MIRTFLVLPMLFTFAAPVLEPQDTAPKIDFKKFTDEIKKLVLKEYPKAKITTEGSLIHFEFKTRKFMIHEPLLTGEWQDAGEEIGPQRGGVFCDMEFLAGKYAAQAAVPQKFDKRYFTTSLSAPYSKELDCHLYIHFKYPQNVSPKFAKDFQDLADRFGEYCEIRKDKK